MGGLQVALAVAREGVLQPMKVEQVALFVSSA